jgi:hypothetical protein
MKIYVDAHGREFQVVELINEDSGVWIHYRRINDGAEFSCLLDSFNNRFTPSEVLR